MAIMDTQYLHPQETWDEKKCARLAKRTWKDGLGTKIHFKGFIPKGELGHYAHGMDVTYNGGCVREGNWHPGEKWLLPILTEGYEFVYRSTWGYQIVKKTVIDNTQGESNNE